MRRQSLSFHFTAKGPTKTEPDENFATVFIKCRIRYGTNSVDSPFTGGADEFGQETGPDSAAPFISPEDPEVVDFKKKFAVGVEMNPGLREESKTRRFHNVNDDPATVASDGDESPFRRQSQIGERRAGHLSFK